MRTTFIVRPLPDSANRSPAWKIRRSTARWDSICRLPADEITIRRASELAERYGLRAYDSLHLAAGETLQRALHATVTFGCFDRNLKEAVGDLGMNAIQ